MKNVTKLIVNFDDLHAKRSLMVKLGTLRGRQEVIIKPHGGRRSNNANAYWWGCVVEYFRAYNESQDEHFTAQQCHDILKRELLPVRVFTSPRTGKPVAVLADTHTMTPQEFGDLIERAVAYLAQMGIVVPDPYTFGGVERPTTRRAGAA